MVHIDSFRNMALAFKGTYEVLHFDRIAFRTSLKIFASVHQKTMQANLKLSLKDQDIFSLIDKNKIYPLANKWGLQGWTTFELTTIDAALLNDALAQAYAEAIKPGK